MAASRTCHRFCYFFLKSGWKTMGSIYCWLWHTFIIAACHVQWKTNESNIFWSFLACISEIKWSFKKFVSHLKQDYSNTQKLVTGYSDVWNYDSYKCQQASCQPYWIHRILNCLKTESAFSEKAWQIWQIRILYSIVTDFFQILTVIWVSNYSCFKSWNDTDWNEKSLKNQMLLSFLWLQQEVPWIFPEKWLKRCKGPYIVVCGNLPLQPAMPNWKEMKVTFFWSLLHCILETI